MHNSVMRWVKETLPDVSGWRVVELGSYNVNGSVRPLCESAKEYLGVDIRKGRGVDVVCDVSKGGLSERYGHFDLVMSTETLEHVAEWRSFIHAAKMLCCGSGQIILTARGPGFKRHAHPNDYWRFTVADMERAFSDCTILECIPDPAAHGVFVHVAIPDNFTPLDMELLPHPQRAPAR